MTSKASRRIKAVTRAGDRHDLNLHRMKRKIQRPSRAYPVNGSVAFMTGNCESHDR